MKALIFNSGLGSRLGALTADRPKSLVRLGNGETILGRQLRLLSGCGIREFVITTGPFPEKVEAEARRFEARGCTFSFVPNPIYAETNAIYSMHCARGLLGGDDFVVLHGDLVFDARTASEAVNSPEPTLGLVDPHAHLPEKDFKARIADGLIREISVGAFGDDCVAFQPFYKVAARDMEAWTAAVARLVDEGRTGVYAEEALNAIFGDVRMAPLSYEHGLVGEVDTPEDLAEVGERMRLVDIDQQPVFRAAGTAEVELAGGFAPAGAGDAAELGGLVRAMGMRRPLVVSGSRFGKTYLRDALAGVPHEVFGGYEPNPTLEQVQAGLAAFRAAGCDGLVSVGGGSAMDVAKCIKALAAEGAAGLADVPGMAYSGLPHLAVPTTAGTGSESTSFAVCYVAGEKASVAHDCLLPDAALLDATLLADLPDYQKKCCLLDALCQAIESHWSSRSSEGSRRLSSAAIPPLVAAARAYVAGDGAAAWQVLRAANLAGRAINITKTTAAHAMAYKLTSLYGIPHGHAVAMGMPFCWETLMARAEGELSKRLSEISLLMGGSGMADDGLREFYDLVAALGVPMTADIPEGDLDLLAGSVNIERLSNFPVAVGADELRAAYAAMRSRR